MLHAVWHFLVIGFGLQHRSVGVSWRGGAAWHPRGATCLSCVSRDYFSASDFLPPPVRGGPDEAQLSENQLAAKKQKLSEAMTKSNNHATNVSMTDVLQRLALGKAGTGDDSDAEGEGDCSDDSDASDDDSENVDEISLGGALASILGKQKQQPTSKGKPTAKQGAPTARTGKKASGSASSFTTPAKAQAKSVAPAPAPPGSDGKRKRGRPPSKPAVIMDLGDKWDSLVEAVGKEMKTAYD
eukprot:8605567-Pyramimonas_sp.AAC.1